MEEKYESNYDKKKILIVDDEKPIVEILTYNLHKEGYETIEAYDGEQAITLALTQKPDLILLDIMLQKVDGLTVCKRIRHTLTNVPILILSAKDEEIDKILGLELGADDYITKPFSVMVLCKKVAAVFANMELRTPKHDVFEDEVLKIDFSEQSAVLEGKVIEFTPKEYRTLFLFVKNPHIILTKRQLIEKLWDIDGDFIDEHTLTTIISRIRKKIETDERKYIKTAYGMGYQWIGGESR